MRRLSPGSLLWTAAHGFASAGLVSSPSQRNTNQASFRWNSSSTSGTASLHVRRLQREHRRLSSVEQATDVSIRQGLSTYLTSNYQNTEGCVQAVAGVKMLPLADLFSSTEFCRVVADLQPLPQSVDVEAFLDSHLNNHDLPCDLELCERNSFLLSVRKKLTECEKDTGSAKPGLVWAIGMRGIGKTSALKRLIYNDPDLNRRCSWGRVLVLESTMEWAKALVAKFVHDRSGESEFLISLIRQHLENVMGPVSEPRAKDVKAAYKQWSALTAARYRIPPEQDAKPLIVIDSCETFAMVNHATLVHTTLDTRPYSLLEALPVEIPDLNCIVAIGTFAEAASKGIYGTHVNVATVPDGQLALLTRDASFKWLEKEAVRRRLMGKYDQHMHEIVHALTAGLPRLMMRSLQPVMVPLGTLREAYFPMLNDFVEYAGAIYKESQSASPKIVSLLMASAVKWNQWPLAVPEGHQPGRDCGMQFKTVHAGDASRFNVGAVYSKTRVVCPPVFGKFVDPAVVQSITGLKNVDVSAIVMPFSVETMREFAVIPATARGLPFEQASCHALLIRYALARWKQQSDPKCAEPDWVPLWQLLASHTLPKEVDFDDIEHVRDWSVNLSEGLVTPGPTATSVTTYEGFAARQPKYALQWNVNVSNQHHDAYMWGRRQQQKQQTKGFVEAPIALQMRHGQPKTYQELSKQLHRAPKSKDKVELLLSLFGGDNYKVAPFVTLVNKAKACKMHAEKADASRFAEINMDNLMDASAIWALDVHNNRLQQSNADAEGRKSNPQQ